MMVWICDLLPAAMLETVQQASFLIAFFEEFKRASNGERTLQSNTTWVWMSSPVTKLPMVLSAGVLIATEECLSVKGVYKWESGGREMYVSLHK